MQPKPDGSTYTSQNGYHYTKVNGRYIATHKHLMEQKLGRPLEKGERVRFKDGDRTNLTVDNLEVVNRQARSIRSQLAKLYSQRDDILAMIEDLEQQLKLDVPLADSLKDLPVHPAAQGAVHPKTIEQQVRERVDSV